MRSHLLEEEAHDARDLADHRQKRELHLHPVGVLALLEDDGALTDRVVDRPQDIDETVVGTEDTLTAYLLGEAERNDVDLLDDVAKKIMGRTICALGDAAAWPIQGLIRNFRPVIEERIDQAKASRIAAE